MPQLNTLPDLLKPDLDLVFVGINPGTCSARAGHYYARPGNLFWCALHQSGLVQRAVCSRDDAALLEEGIGFTDVVKRPSDNADQIHEEEFRRGAQELVEKILLYQPLVVCFNGLKGYREGFDKKAGPGPQSQEKAIGPARVYVVPSTSRRNAHYQWDKVLCCFQDLKAFLDGLRDAERLRDKDG